MYEYAYAKSRQSLLPNPESAVCLRSIQQKKSGNRRNNKAFPTCAVLNSNFLTARHFLLSFCSFHSSFAISLSIPVNKAGSNNFRAIENVKSKKKKGSVSLVLSSRSWFTGVWSEDYWSYSPSMFSWSVFKLVTYSKPRCFSIIVSGYRIRRMVSKTWLIVFNLCSSYVYFTKTVRVRWLTWVCPWSSMSTSFCNCGLF